MELYCQAEECNCAEPFFDNVPRINFQFSAITECPVNPSFNETIVDCNHREWSEKPRTDIQQFDLSENIQTTAANISSMAYNFTHKIKNAMSDLVDKARNQIRSQKFKVEDLHNRLLVREEEAAHTQEAVNILKINMEKEIDHLRDLYNEKEAWFFLTKNLVKQKQRIYSEEVQRAHNRESALKLEMLKLEKEIIKLQLEKTQLANTVKTAVMRGLCMLNSETLSVLGPIDLKLATMSTKDAEDTNTETSACFCDLFKERHCSCVCPHKN